jgi:hypothetical protein
MAREITAATCMRFWKGRYLHASSLSVDAVLGNFKRMCRKREIPGVQSFRSVFHLLNRLVNNEHLFVVVVCSGRCGANFVLAR